MRKQFLFTIAVWVMVSMTSCFHHRGSTIITNYGNDYIEINYSGQVRFNDSETAIESITPGGYLNYRKNGKKLLVDENPNGGLELVINDDGRRLSPDDAEGKRFIADAVHEMIYMGFDAERRMKRLYKSGGAAALLDEVDNLKDDNLKSMYLSYLVGTDSLTKNDKLEIVHKTNSIGSDFEKANLLNRLGTGYLRDSAITSAYFECVKGVGSDFDKSNIIRNIARQKLTNEQYDNVLDLINSIGSDFEKQNCMRELISSQDISSQNYGRTLDAIDHVGSDFEKQNLINQLLDQKAIPAEQVSKLIHTTENVGSDFEKVGLLRKIGGKDIHDEQYWIELLGAASRAGSDFDKSNLLVDLSKKMPQGETIKAAYRNAAKSIGSDADYARAIREIN